MSLVPSSQSIDPDKPQAHRPHGQGHGIAFGTKHRHTLLQRTISDHRLTDRELCKFAPPVPGWV